MEVKLSATGFWKLNNSGDEYVGDLYLNEDEGAIIIYIRIPNSGAPMSYLKLPLNISFITGKMISGGEITLVNCSRVSTESRIGTEEVFGYSAQFMFNGMNFDKEEDIKFSKLTVNVPGIIQWGDVSNYIEPDLDERRESFIDLKNIEPIEIYSNNTYTLLYHLSYSLPSHLMEEEITLNQNPYLIIESEDLQTIPWYIKTAQKMKRLLEIAIGTPLCFGSISVESPNIYYEFDEGKKHPRPLKVLHALKGKNNNNFKSNRLHKHNYLFNLDELKSANFLQWQEKSEEMEPIIELYIDSLYNEYLSIERHFLNMIQALETYHSRMIASTIRDYKQRVEDLVKERPKDIQNDQKKFLLGDSYKQVTLKARLTDLIIADFKFRFYTGEFTYLEFPQIIATTRNYYIHYNQRLENKALKGEDLRVAFHILRNILEFYLLKEFGFDEHFIHERIRKRIDPIRTSIDIRNADKVRSELK